MTRRERWWLVAVLWVAWGLVLATVWSRNSWPAIVACWVIMGMSSWIMPRRWERQL